MSMRCRYLFSTKIIGITMTLTHIQKKVHHVQNDTLIGVLRGKGSQWPLSDPSRGQGQRHRARHPLQHRPAREEPTREGQKGMPGRFWDWWQRSWQWETSGKLSEQQFEKKMGKHGGSWSSQRTEHQSESYMCKKVWFDYKWSSAQPWDSFESVDMESSHKWVAWTQIMIPQFRIQWYQGTFWWKKIF